MKTSKIFGMLLAAVMCLTLNSCSLLFGGNMDDLGISELKDSGSELSWSINEYVYTATFHYGYDRQENITSYVLEHKFSSVILARIWERSLKEAMGEETEDFDDEGESVDFDAEDAEYAEEVSRKGKTVTVTYGQGAYEDMTKQDVIEMYNILKEEFDFEE